MGVVHIAVNERERELLDLGALGWNSKWPAFVHALASRYWPGARFRILNDSSHLDELHALEQQGFDEVPPGLDVEARERSLMERCPRREAPHGTPPAEGCRCALCEARALDAKAGGFYWPSETCADCDMPETFCRCGPAW